MQFIGSMLVTLFIYLSLCHAHVASPSKVEAERSAGAARVSRGRGAGEKGTRRGRGGDEARRGGDARRDSEAPRRRHFVCHS